VKRITPVIVWSVAFAYVESAVVEYLRAIYSPLNSGGFGFPLLTLQELEMMGPEHTTRVLIECARELATLVMLAAVGIIAGRNRREAFAHFMIAFGVWDIAFYVWLKVLLGWPESIMTWDLLFLVPVPWVSPVLAPVIISVAMVAAGLTILFYESKEKPLYSSWKNWVLLVGGGVIVIVSCCWDYRNIMAGGLPNPFNWPLFVIGLGLSGFTFLWIVRRNVRALG
jgi:hypothetical protein